MQGARLEVIKLNEPDKKRGLPFMEALSTRASVRVWSDRDVSLQDLSDLLWAAQGINRPDEMKCTASSAQNAQEVAIYLFMKDGVYLYEPCDHILKPVMSGDFRSQLMMAPPPRPPAASGPPPPPPPPPPPSNPPIQIILVADVSRFKFGPPELKPEWAAIDTGIVSQNISLFCAATGMATRPRASMDKEVVKSLLALSETQCVLLNHPIGYPA
jgi:hypothetical protein